MSKNLRVTFFVVVVALIVGWTMEGSRSLILAMLPSLPPLTEPQAQPESAILLDTGGRGTKLVVDLLTTLPVIIPPSHLQLDHVGNHTKFNCTEMPGQSHLRKKAQLNQFQLSLPEHLGFVEGYGAPVLKISECWALGSSAELGSRTIPVIQTLGHSSIMFGGR